MNTAVIRARAQHLLTAGPTMSSPEDVIGHFGCMQAQDFAMAKWAVARRVDGLSHAAIDQAFTAGGFLRTHILRPTWHFVLPADLGWITALTAPRVLRLMTSANKQLGLTEVIFERAADVVAAALRAGRPLTRRQLAEQLGAAGIDTRDNRLAHLLMHCELHALIGNGPPVAKQHTYTLLAAGPATPMGTDEALARLARTYVRGHGPSRPHDLSWWSSLTLAQSRRAFALAELQPCRLDGEELWSLTPPLDLDPPVAALMPPFDESISYRAKPVDRARFPDTVPDLARGGGLLFLNGLIGGSWRRTMTATTVVVTVSAAGPLSTKQRRAITAEAERYAAFLGTTLDLRVGG